MGLRDYAFGTAMMASILRLTLPCVVVLSAMMPMEVQAQRYNNLYFRWSQEGAGFRSITAQSSMVYLFRQAGLIDREGTRFASTSFSSSGLWFSTALFWSDVFFEKTAMAESPDALYDFMFQWAENYNKIWNPIGDLAERGQESLPIRVLSQFSFKLKDAIIDILDFAATDYGDPGLMDRRADYDNRVSALRNTDLYLGNGYHPNVRYIDGLGPGQGNSLTFFGPSDSDTVYASPITIQYAVKDDGVNWFPALPFSELPIRSCVTRQVPLFWNLDDWRKFNTFPENREGNGRLLVPKSEIPPCDYEGLMTLPYDGEAPTVKDTALSGALPTAEVTSSAPSSFTQIFTAIDYMIKNGIGDVLGGAVGIALGAGFQILWGLWDQLVDLGHCAVDRPCRMHDPSLTHNNGIIAGSLGLTLGQHHSVDNADRSRTLKLIYTVDAYNAGVFSQYFYSDLNARIWPGGYYWRVDSGGEPDFSPLPSQQLFAQRLDRDDFYGNLDKVEGTYIKYGRLDLTTVDNPIFHVDGGQRVDLLILAASEDHPIPPVPILGVDPHEFGDAARKNAASEELVDIIRDFASGSGRFSSTEFSNPIGISEPGPKRVDTQLFKQPPSSTWTSWSTTTTTTTSQEGDPTRVHLNVNGGG